MNRLVVLALSAVFTMGLLARFGGGLIESAPSDSDRPVHHVATGAFAAGESAGNEAGTEIRRDASGQFRVDARINGESEKFLIDTGADSVVLTVETAEHAGIHVDPTTFEPMMQTASGTGKGAPVMIDQIELAGHEFHDVNAVVLDGLQTNLLGQSMLRRFAKVEMKGDRMVIGKD